MAPFKLKFRMGGSRSTSQEQETEQVTQALLNHGTTGTNSSSTTTIDSEHNSMGSFSSDRRSLLPQNATILGETCGGDDEENIGGGNAETDENLGYINPVSSDNQVENNTSASTTSINTSTCSVPYSPPPTYEQVLEENRLANLDRDSSGLLSSGPTFCETILLNSHPSTTSLSHSELNERGDNLERDEDHDEEDVVEERECSCSTMASSKHNLLECNGSCNPLLDGQSEENINLADRSRSDNISEKSIGSAEECGNDDDQCSSMSDNENNSDTEWNSHEHQLQEMQTPEVINNKSSKEIYKAVAKQWGITCKMSDGCRCMECQGNYFDCEYDENEHQKTDGGLGAGTPMFVNEAVGSGCTIL